MSFAVAEDGSRLDLVSDADNWSALQSFCDAHTSIQFSEGVILLSRTLNVKPGSVSWRGRGPDSTTFRRAGAFNGPVVGVGLLGRIPSGYAAAPSFTLADMTVWQTDDSNSNNKCIWNETGDDFLVQGVRVRGSAYEGIVAGSDVVNVTLQDFEAWDCGNGGVAYPLTTAGINCTNRNLVCEDFVTLRCGQGIECGNSPAGVFRRGTVLGPGTNTPSLGCNIGSTGRGVYRLTIEDVTFRGYPQSIQVGNNGIGRLCGVTIQRCDVDQAISFSGGLVDNLVPGQPGEGPSIEGSFILNNAIRISEANTQASILYNTGPSAGVYDVYGREPLTIRGNSVYYASQVQTTPTISFAGKIVANCIVEGNRFYGLTVAPSRGDIASFASGSNPSIPGMPNLSQSNNIAYDLTGRSRLLSVKIEGAP